MKKVYALVLALILAVTFVIGSPATSFAEPSFDMMLKGAKTVYAGEWNEVEVSFKDSQAGRKRDDLAVTAKFEGVNGFVHLDQIDANAAQGAKIKYLLPKGITGKIITSVTTENVTFNLKQEVVVRPKPSSNTSSGPTVEERRKAAEKQAKEERKAAQKAKVDALKKKHPAAVPVGGGKVKGANDLKVMVNYIDQLDEEDAVQALEDALTSIQETDLSSLNHKEQKDIIRSTRETLKKYAQNVNVSLVQLRKDAMKSITLSKEMADQDGSTKAQYRSALLDAYQVVMEKAIAGQTKASIYRTNDSLQLKVNNQKVNQALVAMKEEQESFRKQLEEAEMTENIIFTPMMTLESKEIDSDKRVTFELDQGAMSALKDQEAGMKMVMEDLEIEMPKDLVETLAGKGLKVEKSVVEDTSRLQAKTAQKTLSVLSKVYDLDILTTSSTETKSMVFDGEKPKMLIRFEDFEDQSFALSKVGVSVYNDTKEEWELVQSYQTSAGVYFYPEHFSKYAVVEMQENFDDMSEHWAANIVEASAAKGLVSGVGNNHFSPDTTITRAQFLAMMVNYINKTEQVKPLYGDIEETQWYYATIAKAVASGLLANGVEPLEPNNPIPRREMVLLMHRAAVIKNGNVAKGELSAFVDIDGVSASEKAAIEFCSTHQLVSGYEDKTFRPDNLGTRAEATAMLANLFDWLQ